MSMKVYLDNAATTQLDSQVISEMNRFMNGFYGNPSSTHARGREARVELEKARKKIASLVGAFEKEIIFTSGGTEANNAVLKSLALSNKINRIISSPIEHHSVLDTLHWLKTNTNIEIVYLNLDIHGDVDLEQLEILLREDTTTLVSLMHANNEIGNLLNLQKVGELCSKHKTLFHSDMVQTLGHFPINLHKLPIDFATASAHKNHGPKGIGFIYINSKTSKLPTFSHGGSQERGIRGGTENSIGIIGMAKAYEVSIQSLEKDREHISILKQRMIDGLTKSSSEFRYNGNSDNKILSLYNLINIRLNGPANNTLLLNLDLEGIFVSEGSACSSGASKGSHVINVLNKGENNSNNLRISFSKANTIEEVDYAVKVLTKAISRN